MDTLTGLALALIGGAMQGAFVLPMKYLRKWNWENGWLIFTLINCVIFPVALMALTVPGFMNAYRETSFATLNLVFWFGFGWGIGNRKSFLESGRFGCGGRTSTSGKHKQGKNKQCE